jgi:hypothetical protein
MKIRLQGTVAVGIGVIGTAKRRRLMRVNHLRAQQAYFARIRVSAEAGRATELGEVVAVPGLRMPTVVAFRC